MNLFRPLEEIQRTLEYAAERSERRIPSCIADAYLQGQPAALPDLQLIQQRLKQIELIRPLIPQFEDLLSEPELKALNPRLEKDWHMAIDQIADLTVDQQIINKFVERLQLLAQAYNALLESCCWVKLQNSLQSNRSQSFKKFLEKWRSLWLYFFNFHDSTADEAFKSLLP